MSAKTRIASAIGLIALSLLTGSSTITNEIAFADLPACATEDSTNCYWDAAVNGNGEGASFIDRDGVVTYVPECTDAIADARGICYGEPK